jgi:hypothetical protein
MDQCEPEPDRDRRPDEERFSNSVPSLNTKRSRALDQTADCVEKCYIGRTVPLWGQVPTGNRSLFVPEGKHGIDRRLKLIQTLSSILKRVSNTQDSIVQNIKQGGGLCNKSKAQLRRLPAMSVLARSPMQFPRGPCSALKIIPEALPSNPVGQGVLALPWAALRVGQ